MFSNMIIGRYMPGDSWIHRLDARTKLVLSIAFIFVIFFANNVIGYAVATIFTLLAIMLTGLGVGVFIRGVRPLILLMLITTLFQLFFVQTGDVLIHWWFIKITVDGVVNSIVVFVRFMLIIMFSTILTLTTQPLAVADGMESLLKPFKKMGLPVSELALMLSIALRFVPTLMDEAQSIMNAQRARGVRFNEGSLMTRIKSFVPLLIPLFVNAIKRAIELGDAMEARGYRGGDQRTKYRVLTWHRQDTVAIIGFIVFTVVLIATRWMM
ncbi:energy-coupling factor transporter transmembrane component T family protein [Weissella hellenica]|uniref:Energy-coupling factor transporter transmembrane protein EcfT n=1 Tax=Weissella hellenica TaxID=46256 RepID=A0A4Y4G6W2_WEIHE|nr:energy-coupling factor transporter transmembrane protein EcfT [Weissella hellenica]NKY66162.1 energy-coupling factor transporter transmembrane protein EcfT [Weissella hellenica]GED35621.1 energy-coupling factor transporter transmembrane protein EcfT [Weissella hellenica]SCB78789.1 energy-coupling factor transport system permease protein [Weissella hellenica]